MNDWDIAAECLILSVCIVGGGWALWAFVASVLEISKQWRICFGYEVGAEALNNENLAAASKKENQ